MPRPAEAAAPPRGRIAYLDSARALMLLLGIPFHAGEIYRLSGGWRLESPDVSFAATLVDGMIHVFRMPAFFVLAGFFAALVLERRPDGAWLRERCLRLGVPLVCTALAFGWLEDAVPRLLEPGTGPGAAILDALRAGPGAWNNHRWFLVVLLLYCASAVACRRWVPGGALERLGASRGGAAATLGFAALLTLVPFAVAGIGVLTGGGGLGLDGSAPYENFYLRYAIFFACGYVLRRLDGDLARFSRLGPLELGLALAAVSAYLLTHAGFHPQGVAASPGPGLVLARTGADVVAGFYATKLFFAGAGRFLDARSPLVDYLVDASLCIYLVHFALVLGLGAALLPVRWPPVLEIGIISTLTLALATAAFEATRRSALLSLALNGRKVARPRR